MLSVGGAVVVFPVGVGDVETSVNDVDLLPLLADVSGNETVSELVGETVSFDVVIPVFPVVVAVSVDDTVSIIPVVVEYADDVDSILPVAHVSILDVMNVYPPVDVSVDDESTFSSVTAIVVVFVSVVVVVVVVFPKTLIHNKDE